jgi:hypothetical protein
VAVETPPTVTTISPTKVENDLDRNPSKTYRASPALRGMRADSSAKEKALNPASREAKMNESGARVPALATTSPNST